MILARLLPAAFLNNEINTMNEKLLNHASFLHDLHLLIIFHYYKKRPRKKIENIINRYKL